MRVTWHQRWKVKSLLFMSRWISLWRFPVLFPLTAFVQRSSDMWPESHLNNPWEAQQPIRMLRNKFIQEGWMIKNDRIRIWYGYSTQGSINPERKYKTHDLLFTLLERQALTWDQLFYPESTRIANLSLVKNKWCTNFNVPWVKIFHVAFSTLHEFLLVNGLMTILNPQGVFLQNS